VSAKQTLIGIQAPNVPGQTWPKTAKADAAALAEETPKPPAQEAPTTSHEPVVTAAPIVSAAEAAPAEPAVSAEPAPVAPLVSAEAAAPPALSTEPVAPAAPDLSAEAAPPAPSAEPAPAAVSPPAFSETPPPAASESPVPEPRIHTEIAVVRSAPASARPASFDADDAELFKPRFRRKAFFIPVVLALLLGAGGIVYASRSLFMPPRLEEPVAATPPPEPKPAPTPEPPKPAATPEPEPAPAPTTTTVVVKVNPPLAKFFYKGKAVGTGKMTLELEPGEKRAFEVGMPGYNTRRVIIDGSKPERTIGLTVVKTETESESEPAPE